MTNHGTSNMLYYIMFWCFQMVVTVRLCRPSLHYIGMTCTGFRRGGLGSSGWPQGIFSFLFLFYIIYRATSLLLSYLPTLMEMILSDQSIGVPHLPRQLQDIYIPRSAQTESWELGTELRIEDKVNRWWLRQREEGPTSGLLTCWEIHSPHPWGRARR